MSDYPNMSVQPSGSTKGRPEYADIPQWCALSGMNRTATYCALGRGQLQARKLGRRTLIHVPSGLAFLGSLPIATFRVPKAV